MGVDVELAAVHVEKRFLVGDELITHFDIALGGHTLKHARPRGALGGFAIDATAGHCAGIHTEHAAIDIQ